jgi:hypothetical protein
MSPRLLRFLIAFCALCAVLPAHAQPAKPPPPPSEATWAGQLDQLGRWLESQRKGTACTERCFTLERLRLTGKVGDGPLRFELTGSVLADGPVAVPLFGPPAHVRVDDATEDGKAAIIGFEGDHYFLHTASRRFVLKGSLSLDGDLALTIPGPLNALEADVTAGAVVEGARLTGLTGATVHLSREGAAQAAGPTVFQLSRAVRVRREIAFEYRLVMRSGADLGVVRLPLTFGEKVLEVSGSPGFRVEGSELVLPTSGRTAEMTISGTIANVGRFAPDARSAYEWWLLESDAEHRIKVQGDARQVDSAESPIPRTQSTSRLFLVNKGQHIEVAVTPLSGVDVLAAVVRSHQRTIALTTRGDLVSDDTVAYENNGIDYLLYAPDGRPIYLATDGKAERIMHQGAESRDVLVPLRTGSHAVRVQTLADAGLRAPVGRIDLPMPSYPLTASRVTLQVGVPAHVHPIALLGGDEPAFAHGGGDLFAVLLGFAVAWVATRVAPGTTRSRAVALRLLGGAVLGGLWFWSGPLYVLTMAALAGVAVVWLVSRFLRGPAVAALAVVILGGLGLFALVGLATRSASAPTSPSYAPPAEIAHEKAAPSPSTGDRRDNEAASRAGNWAGQAAVGGVLEGVTPVALTLPTVTRSLHASRELVTRDRPFKPTLIYVTELALWPLGALWLMGALVVLLAHRGPLGALRALVRERLRRAPDSPPPADVP